MTDVHHKCVLVTGAGNGLGRDLAFEFAAKGAHVVVTDIDSDGIEQTVQTIRASGGDAIGLKMDVIDTKSIERARKRLRCRRQVIDILVNNAGIVCGGAFTEVALTRHVAVMKVNALGPMIVTHSFLPDLISRKEAHLVTIVSASGILPVPWQLSYTSSKWAALGFSESLRQELRRIGHHHVRVTSVCSGYLDTTMFNGVQRPWLTPDISSAAMARRIVRAVQTNRKSLLTPWTVKMAPFAKTLLPLSLGERVCDWLGVTDGMCGWVGNGRETGLTSRGVGRIRATTSVRTPRAPCAPTPIDPGMAHEPGRPADARCFSAPAGRRKGTWTMPS